MVLFGGCEWADADAWQLAAALASAHAQGATTQADTLGLGGNQLTGAALPPLLEAIAAGAMPKLRFLYSRNNREMGDAGAVALAGALSAGHLPALEGLYLENTGMGDAGAAALAGSLGGEAALKLLDVRDNAFGEGARAQLVAACEARGVTVHCGYV